MRIWNCWNIKSDFNYLQSAFWFERQFFYTTLVRYLRKISHYQKKVSYKNANTSKDMILETKTPNPKAYLEGKSGLTPPYKNISEKNAA